MSDYIPEEVVNEILLRLPAKSLVKFTAVCKSWRSLIKSSSFIAAHLQFNTENEDARLLFIAGSRARRDNTNGFLVVSRFYCLHWDTPAFIAPPPVADERKPHLIGTCNGLVCMPIISSTRGRLGIVLWNPSTRRYVCSPSRPLTTEIDEESFCFGYDSVNNDYKVLWLANKRRVLAFTGKTLLAEVWSLAKGVWKSLSFETSENGTTAGKRSLAKAKPQQLCKWYDCWKNTSVSSVNSTLHWIQFDKDHSWSLSIATFNLVNESFGKIELPKNGRDAAKGLHITKYGDSLAYCEICSLQDTKGSFFDLWVMKEYAVAESWTILCTVDLRMVYFFRPFCFRRNGELVLEVEDQREHSEEMPISLISVNLKSKQTENLGIDGHPYDLFVDSFTDSLVLLEQANAISY